MSTDSGTISITSLQQRIAELEAGVAALKKADSEIWYRWTKDDLLNIVDGALDPEPTPQMMDKIKAKAWEQIAAGANDAGLDTGMATESINDEIGCWASDFVKEHFPDCAGTEVSEED